MMVPPDDGAVDILLVEDNPGDIRLTREAFAQTTLETDLHVVRDGEEAREDIAESHDRYSNAYLTKPVDPAEFVRLIEAIESFWLTAAKLPPTPSDT